MYEQALLEAKTEIGKIYHVKMDRPIGTAHPKHPDIIYPINYGYIPGLIGGDGEEQDVYILDLDYPVKEADITIIAVVYREDDNETKWVAVSNSSNTYTAEEISNIIHFQEQFYHSKIIL